MRVILNKKFLEKFFKLYSKCSELYSKLSGINRYLVQSYYKEDEWIYPYDYIDFDLLYCHRTGAKNQRGNKFLEKDFINDENNYMKIYFKDNYNELYILNYIHSIILNNFDGLTKDDLLKLNEIYKKKL